MSALRLLFRWVFWCMCCCIVLFSTFRLGVRGYILLKILMNPTMRERINIVPYNKSYENNSLRQDNIHQLVDLGFAQFSLPSAELFVNEPLGSEGIARILSNNGVQIVFLRPFVDYAAIGTSIEIQIEHTKIPSLSEIIFMNDNDFTLLVEQLLCKSSIIRGKNEVYSYTTEKTFGLVRIGDLPDDMTCASMVISSASDNTTVGGHIKLLQQGSRNQLAEYLDEILSTFCFVEETNGIIEKPRGQLPRKSRVTTDAEEQRPTESPPP